MPRASVLFAALVFSAPALGADTGWLAFPDRCHAELEPAWAAQAALGAKWDADSADNLVKLTELTQKICPNYLAHPNDGDAIRAFNASKGFILDHAPVVEKNGDALLLFLKSGFDDYERTFYPSGLDFSQTPCGLHMRATQKGTYDRLTEVRAKIQSLAKTCFVVNDAAIDATQKAKSPAKALGNGGPGHVAPSAGSQKSTGSDITGTQEDRAKSQPIP